MTEQRKIRWGVIGATARIARERTIPAIMESENGRLLAVASRNAAAAREVAGECGDCRAYGDYDSLLADDEVDAVYIPLPNSLHVGWAIEAMNNGKHVLCEEPLAVTAAEAEEMVQTARENGVVLSEAMMYYYHPLRTALRDVLASGEIGDIRLVKASVSFLQRDPDDFRRDPRMGGGALLDVGCYCVHVARRTFETALSGGASRDGDLAAGPVSVAAYSLVDPETGIDTTTTAQIEFPEGLALIDCSFSMVERSTYEVVGTRGSISVPVLLPAPDVDAKMVVTTSGSAPRAVIVPRADMYVAELDIFARTVIGEEAGLLPATDAIRNMTVLDAIASAARTGRRVSISSVC